MNRTIIINGRVLDPGQDLDDLRDVMIEDGRVFDMVAPGAAGDWAAGGSVIDARGRLVTPGLIDMHVHLREPGQEYKETIASGTAAAAAGGFTAVACMPNTKPVNDNRTVTEYILNQARAVGSARVWPVAAMTKGSQGQELCEYGDLADAGAVAISDDGHPVANSAMMRRVLEYAQVFCLPAISHAEELALSAGGHMNEGPTATRLGIPGIAAAGEEIAVFREISLSRLTGYPIHIAHVSTKAAVQLIRQAKAAGISVTAETAPHYFTLTDEAVDGYRTEAKMNPPLRSAEDREAIRAALADGTIDAIATDHAPHSVLEKDVEFTEAAFGIVGLETALPLTLDLVRSGLLSMVQAVRALSQNPAAILKVQGGSLAKGRPADLTVIDPDRQWVVDADRFKSRGRNTPFNGQIMTGQAVLTMVQGRVTHHLID